MDKLAASQTQLTLDLTTNINGTKPVYRQASLAVRVSLAQVTWPCVLLTFGFCLAGIFFFLATVYTTYITGAPLRK